MSARSVAVSSWFHDGFSRESGFWLEASSKAFGMHHYGGVTLVALAVAGLMGCRAAPQGAAHTGPPAAQLSRSDRLLLAAATIGLPPAGVAPGDLPEPASRGAQLVAKYCAQCHSLPAPATHSATDWPSVARRMWLRMEWLPDSLAVQVPTNAERYELLQYLTLNALRISGAALPEGRGRETFALICSRCHALPDPRVHSRQDWPIVFARMEGNMERMKVRPPTGPEGQDILAYLTAEAGGKPRSRSGSH
jgi:cytochrome c5